MTDKELDATHIALPISLLRTREQVMERFRPMLAERGITEAQWRVMRVLDESGALDASTVADRACILLPSLTRIAKTLGDAGWLDSARDSRDGRKTRLSLTAQGRAVLRDAAPQSAAVYAEIEAAIGREKLAQLQDLLVEVRRALQSDP